MIEVALAMTLLIAAGLLLQSMRQLQQVDPGFRPDHLLTMNVWLPGAKYPKAADYLAFYERLRERLCALPGVDSLGLTSIIPGGTDFDKRGVALAGRPLRPGGQPEVDNYTVTPGYFGTMGVPLRAGRFLNARDGAKAPLVVLVSETMARKYWPNESALGQRIRYYGGGPNEEQIWRSVVGVVGDVKQYGLDTAGTPALYVPLPQLPNSAMTLVVRTEGAPAAIAPFIRREILALDPDEAVFNVATMGQLLRDSTALRRFAMFLLGVFAGLALLLAVIGLYGVISYSVTQRTREMGIRIALGAQRRDVLGLVLREGLRFVVLGIGIGLLASLALTRLLTSLLFGVSTTDPLTFLAFSFALAAVAFLACLLPARRASTVNPVEALRAG